MELKQLQGAIEGILFAAGDPVPVERICLALEQDRETVDSVCQSLADEYSYDRRGFRLVRLENSWQMCSAPEYAMGIRKALESRKPPKLSQPALEALAIVAYFQPVTRAYIEQVRGVDSSYTVGLLLERGLICEAGRLNVPGRPMQFRTTKTFLRSFGLTSLDDLPELPSSTQEGVQMTLELESAIDRLQQEQQGGQPPQGSEGKGAQPLATEGERQPEGGAVP